MGTEQQGRWTITTAQAADRRAWEELFTAYGAGAGRRLTPAHLDRVWSWITGSDARTQCLLLRPEPGSPPVGLAHVRAFERPLDGSWGGYLDDLFVSVEARGRGGARALLTHLASLAAASSWTTVRWTTAPTNPARSLYDAIARASDVVTYDLSPAGDG